MYNVPGDAQVDIDNRNDIVNHIHEQQPIDQENVGNIDMNEDEGIEPGLIEGEIIIG